MPIDEQPILEARDLVKTYGHVQALRGADFTAHAGEIVALIGDNGAGKSTLIKLLSGVEQPDGGELRFEGRPIEIASPLAAQRLGIETVYQDLALAPDLDGAANIFLGRERMRPGLLGRLGVLDKRAMHDGAAQSFAELGVAIRDPAAAVATLSGGQRQGVAVARAASWASKVVIMDEPTAALGVVQSARVLDAIRQVRDRGLAVILVSHNMPDVLAVADRIEVLRLGRRVARFTRAEATLENLVGAMTGRTGGPGRMSSLPDTRAPAPASALRGRRSRRGRDADCGSIFSSASPVWIFLALMVIVAVFAVMRPSQFLGSYDIKSIFINASVALMLSVGMTFVIITAGIDLSVGSVLVFSGVIAAKVMIAVGGGAGHAEGAGWGAILVGCLAGLATGVGWGVINGGLTALLGIPPLIVTLGTFGMALGLSDVVTGGTDVTGIPSRFGTTIGNGQLGPFPWLVIIAVVVHRCCSASCCI